MASLLPYPSSSPPWQAPMPQARPNSRPDRGSELKISGVVELRIEIEETLRAVTVHSVSKRRGLETPESWFWTLIRPHPRRRPQPMGETWIGPVDRGDSSVCRVEPSLPLLTHPLKPLASSTASEQASTLRSNPNRAATSRDV